MAKKVVIIGSGIAGLATANLLAKAGYDVDVYEKGPQLGGRAGQSVHKGFRFDTGPSWYLMPEVFRQYFGLFNVDIERSLQLTRLHPAYKVFYESRKPVTIHGDIAVDQQTFEAIEPGAGRALVKYTQRSQEAYRLALKHFLYTNFERHHELLHPEVISKSGSLFTLLMTPIHRYVTGYFRTQALQQIMEYPMVFLGSSPFSAPAMYSLMSALDFKDGVYYPQKGMYSIVEELAAIGKSLNVKYHLNTKITHIVSTHGTVSGVKTARETVRADIVVSNADLHFTEMSLLSPADRSYPESYWEKQEAGISALLVYLGIKGTLPQLEHHNLFFVEHWQENFADIYENHQIPEHASLYVSRTSATDPTAAPKDHENLFMLIPLPTGLDIDNAQQAALAERFIQQLAISINQPDLMDRIVFQDTFGPRQFIERFNSWQGSALGLSHRLKQSAFWRTPNVSKKVKGLYYTGGNTVPGVGVPMCLISAELTYKKIVGIRHGHPLRKEELI